MTRDDIIGLTRSERREVYGLRSWAARWRLLARVERMRFKRERERAEWAVGQLHAERDEAQRVARVLARGWPAIEYPIVHAAHCAALAYPEQKPSARAAVTAELKYPDERVVTVGDLVGLRREPSGEPPPCAGCGHEAERHKPALAGICIGCPCMSYVAPSASTEGES